MKVTRLLKPYSKVSYAFTSTYNDLIRYRTRPSNACGLRISGKGMLKLLKTWAFHATTADIGKVALHFQSHHFVPLPFVLSLFLTLC
jgi:hypothetical protein